jgi:adenosine deaminase
MINLRERIHDLPKADVHNHLHLSGSIKFFREKYSNSRITIPQYYNGFDGMMEFINNNINTIILTSDDVIFLMEIAIQSAIKDNVQLLESSVDIGLARFFNNSIEKLINEVTILKGKYASQINFKPDIGINKNTPTDLVYSDGLKCIKSGVFNGIDLYGKESCNSLEGFVNIYNTARDNDLKTKVHTGEFLNTQTIEDTILLLNPDVIQHGIKACDSEKTMDMILNRNIQLNICLQSNISLRSVNNIMEHPIRKLYDHGIKITLNTDDLLLFNATITDQFMDLFDHNIFTFEEIEQIRKNGFD